LRLLRIRPRVGPGWLCAAPGSIRTSATVLNFCRLINPNWPDPLAGAHASSLAGSALIRSNCRGVAPWTSLIQREGRPRRDAPIELGHHLLAGNRDGCAPVLITPHWFGLTATKAVSPRRLMSSRAGLSPFLSIAARNSSADRTG